MKSSALGMNSKGSSKNYTPISPLRYHGQGGNPHYGDTKMMETQFSKYSRQTLD